jgi:glycosyltransferase involved in cell wall biosynthesis
MANVLISVVIPVYNRQETIERCLDSVFNQAFSNYEVIIIDDGSTDSTSSCIENYFKLKSILYEIDSVSKETCDLPDQDSTGIFSVEQPTIPSTPLDNPKWYLKKQFNQGPAVARNTGVLLSSGKYIAFLDSDDVWPTYTLPNFAKIIQTHPDVSFIAGSSLKYNINSHSTTIDRRQPPLLNYDLFASYYKSSRLNLWIGTPSTCIRRSHLVDVGLFDNHRLNAEDSHLWLKLGLAGTFVFIKSPHVFVHYTTKNSAVTNLENTFLGILYILNYERKSLYPGGSAYKYDRSRIISRHIKPLCLTMAKMNHPFLGFKLYCLSMSHLLRSCSLRFAFAYPIYTLFCLVRVCIKKR